jgi:predicted metal-dependent hydrolase
MEGVKNIHPHGKIVTSVVRLVRWQLELYNKFQPRFSQVWVVAHRGVVSRVFREQSRWYWQLLHQQRHRPDEVSPLSQCQLLSPGSQCLKRSSRISFGIPKRKAYQPPRIPNVRVKYLSQLLEQKILPAVKIVEHLRSTCISFASLHERSTAVLADELIHQPWNTLVRLNPVTISATEDCISDV